MFFKQRATVCAGYSPVSFLGVPALSAAGWRAMPFPGKVFLAVVDAVEKKFLFGG
ncbi:MAG TPA: hypothetical protein PLS67_03380 [Accumulibacter sp.]|nr:hypothetical protein [Accumulibacter sp.]HQC79550.1 hypothetical protein [Accumulibacter sp.]